MGHHRALTRTVSCLERITTENHSGSHHTLLSLATLSAARRFCWARSAGTSCATLRCQTSVLLMTGGIAIVGMPGQVTVLKLAPGTHLRLHTGPKNQRLTLHLGLTVPLGPTIRVGALPGEVREWEEGKVIAFDDSFVHEVRARPVEPSSTHPPTFVRRIGIHLNDMQAWPLSIVGCLYVSRV